MLSIEKCKKLKGLWKNREFKIGDWVYIEYGNPRGETKWKENLLLEVSKKRVKANNLHHYGKWIGKTEVILIPSTKDMLEKLPEHYFDKEGRTCLLGIFKHKNKWSVEYGTDFMFKDIIGYTDIDEALYQMLDYLITNKYIEVK